MNDTVRCVHSIILCRTPVGAAEAMKTRVNKQKRPKIYNCIELL